MPTHSKATLIFPSCGPGAEAYARAAKEHDESVIAASSLDFDGGAGRFDTWFKLPSVYAGNFLGELNQAVQKYGIGRIYCPVPAAHAALTRMAHDRKVRVPFIGDAPAGKHAREHRELLEHARVLHRFIQHASLGRSPLDVLEVASVLRQSMALYGESDEIKIAAIMAIFADAPPGDIVEIGVLAGRTACVLALMAQRHGIGPVLVVDPWTIDQAIQEESTEDVRTAVLSWDTRALFESFIIGLLPFATRGRFNYVRRSSRDAYRIWSKEKKADSPHFGTVGYGGSLSVLHIDGNHDFARVSEDCKMWLTHLSPSGWVVLDDYVSYHCDGPRRVGDALLHEQASRIERTFVSGKALFI